MKKIKITYDPTKKLNNFMADYGRSSEVDSHGIRPRDFNTWEFKIGYFECQDPLLVLFMLIILTRLK